MRNFLCLAVAISWAGEARLKAAAMPTYAILVVMLLLTLGPSLLRLL